MASKAPPPLIRSSKAFSVEIPEGSNSAKARRSDVVGSDSLDIRPSSSNFLNLDPDQGAANAFHDAQPLDLGTTFGEDDVALDSHLVNEQLAGLKDRFAAEQAGPDHADNMVHEDETPPENRAKLPGEVQLAPAKGVDLDMDALKDRFAGGDAGQVQQAGGVAVDGDAYKDHLQGIADEALQDNIQGVGNDVIKDNLQGLDDDAFQDNVQVVGNDVIKDNLQGLDDDAFQDNVQGVGNEAEHHNKAGVGKEHLADHLEQLPDTTPVLKDGPQPGVHQTEMSGGHQADEQALSPSKRKAQTALDPTHAQAVLLAQQEKAKKIEEFRGRVDAIRKTVSGINHTLDTLNEDGTPTKP